MGGGNDFVEAGRRAAFGFMCGTITGLTVGAVDAYKLAKKFKPANVTETVAVYSNEMARGGIIFAGFFTIYQVAKFGIQVKDPNHDETTATMGASLLAFAPLSVAPALRRNIPFAMTLVGVDAYHSYTRKAEQLPR